MVEVLHPCALDIVQYPLVPPLVGVSIKVVFVVTDNSLPHEVVLWSILPEKEWSPILTSIFYRAGRF